MNLLRLISTHFLAAFSTPLQLLHFSKVAIQFPGMWPLSAFLRRRKERYKYKCVRVCVLCMRSWLYIHGGFFQCESNRQPVNFEPSSEVFVCIFCHLRERKTLAVVLIKFFYFLYISTQSQFCCTHSKAYFCKPKLFQQRIDGYQLCPHIDGNLLGYNICRVLTKKKGRNNWQSVIESGLVLEKISWGFSHFSLCPVNE